MRRALPATDAKARFADALRQAEGGDVVMITRYGKPVVALVSAERLERLESLAAEAPAVAARGVAEASGGAAGGGHTAGDPTPEDLLERSAAPSLRRIDDDFQKLPEKLRPVLRLIRENLFHPGLTVERIKATLHLGDHDVTTRFRHATGATIRRYFEDRRLECGGRLLVDTDLAVDEIGKLVGYQGSEPFARAFKRRYGQRPPIYREFGGRLSLRSAREDEVEADA